jgi:hypothetical protein
MREGQGFPLPLDLEDQTVGTLDPCDGWLDQSERQICLTRDHFVVHHSVASLVNNVL